MKIALINCHPRIGSLSDALTSAYSESAMAGGAQIQTLNIRDLQFDVTIDPQQKRQLEPDLQKAQALISWCEHLCLVFPTWWTGLPALGKGFIDRVFQSGFAFEYTDKFPQGLLKGRSARIIHTMASPVLYNYWFVGKPQIKMIREGTLKFCGFSPVRVTAIGGVRNNAPKVDHYLLQARKAATQDLRAS